MVPAVRHDREHRLRHRQPCADAGARNAAADRPDGRKHRDHGERR